MLKKSVIAVLIASVLTAVLRTVLVINNMETNFNNSSYYLLDNIQTKIFSVGTVVAVAALFVLALILFKGKKAVINTRDVLSSAASCTLAFILFGTFVVFAKAYFTDEASLGGLGIPVAALSILSGCTFLFAGVNGKGDKLLAMFTLCPMVFTLCRLLSDFLASASAPFASSGGYHLMGLSVLLLYFLCEGKAFLSTGSAALLCAYGFVAIFLLSAYALPNLVLHCVGFGVFGFDYGAALSVADLVTAFYIAARLCSSNLVPLKDEQE